MVKLIEKDPIYTELYEAITYFYGRQQLVLRVIVEQGVKPHEMRGASSWQGKTPQRGEWGDWHYYFHGGGCKITHRTTAEPINWEGPDPAAFSSMSFIYHLEWRLGQGASLPLLRDHVDQRGMNAVLELIRKLMADSILSHDYHLIAWEQINAA